MENVGLTRALEHYAKKKAGHLNDMKDLVRIPSVSFPGLSPGPA